jgi:hypothetical protein
MTKIFLNQPFLHAHGPFAALPSCSHQPRNGSTAARWLQQRQVRSWDVAENENFDDRDAEWRAVGQPRVVGGGGGRGRFQLQNSREKGREARGVSFEMMSPFYNSEFSGSKRRRPIYGFSAFSRAFIVNGLRHSFFTLFFTALNRLSQPAQLAPARTIACASVTTCWQTCQV